MQTRHLVVGSLLLVSAAGAARLVAQDAQGPQDEIRMSTMRPVVRGRTQAAASMKPNLQSALKGWIG